MKLYIDGYCSCKKWEFNQCLNEASSVYRVCLFVLKGQVKGNNFYTNCWDAIVCSEIVPLDALLDFGFYGPWLDTS